MTDDHSQLVAEFQGITGAGNDVASFYLEAANWVLEVNQSSSSIIFLLPQLIW